MRDRPAKSAAAAALVGAAAFVSAQIASAAQGVTASMCMYLANHLTPQECLSLVAYLYATAVGEPTAVQRLEQHLPVTESCLSLLTTWNDGDGKGKSFVSVADGLRKIDRENLAEWVSDTVFTQLSMDMESCFLRNKTRATNNDTIDSAARLFRSRLKHKPESNTSEKTILFLLIDTICTYFILMAIVTLVFYTLGLLVRAVKESQNIPRMHKKQYTILEIGILPQDLELEDEILDPFC